MSLEELLERTARVAELQSGSIAVVRNDVFGIPQYPTATDWLPWTEFVSHEQQQELADNPEHFKTRSKQPGCTLPVKPGTFSFGIVMHHPVAAGDQPIEGKLLEAVLGKVTVTAGVSVQYEPAFRGGTYDIWVDYGNAAVLLHRCVMSDFTVKYDPQNECTMMVSIAGQFAARSQMASCQITADYDEVTHGAGSIVYAAGRPHQGGLHKVKFLSSDGLTTYDNAGAGYIITGAFSGGGLGLYAGGAAGADVKCYVTPAFTGALAGMWMVPMFPESTNTSAVAIKAKTLALDVGGAFAAVSDLEFSVKMPITWADKEKTESGYPESYTLGMRECTLSVNGYFKAETLDFEHLATTSERTSVLLSDHPTTPTVSLLMPSVMFGSPNVSPDGDLFSFAVDAVVEPTDKEDEYVLTIK